MTSGMDMAALDSSVDALVDAMDSPRPACALVLGSGWRLPRRDTTILRSVSYASIAALGAAGVDGHAGVVHRLRVRDAELLVFHGRRHWYEGAGWTPVAFPVYAALRMGARRLVLTNAAGSLRPDWEPGAFVAVSDHINAMGVNPLAGPRHPVWGPRFADQTAVYDATLRGWLASAADEAGIPLRHGVYLATPGPAYETPAEVRVFRAMGADAVGMSTVPEAMLAHAAGLRVAAVCCITNFAAGLAPGRITHEDALAASHAAADRMERLLDGFLEQAARSTGWVDGS